MIVSLIIFSTVGAYAIKKFTVMMARDDTWYHQILEENALDILEPVSLEGVHFAFSNFDKDGIKIDIEGMFEWSARQIIFSKDEKTGET